ncbi:hypothetical protein V6N12_024749 [Hibiscus sabdariffa]|uniref:RNase H type-1 domain-containing protein n=1 Tax=Hibiscus sabdariffa TaxID=183260 RepID=A0ABR2BFV3_9ROSI
MVSGLKQARHVDVANTNKRISILGKSSALSGNTIVESTKSLLQLNWEVRLQRIGNVQNRVAYALAVASLLTSGNSRHHQCM